LSGRVLDVGCGIGDFLVSCPGAVGVDINPFTVGFCRKRGLEAHQVEEGLFPFKTGSLDSAILDNLIEHLDDPQPTFKEVFRVVRPWGRILIGVPGRRGYEVDSSHRRFYDVRGLVELMLQQGCMKRRIFGAPFRSAYLDKHMPQYCLYGVFQAPASAEPEMDS